MRILLLLLMILFASTVIAQKKNVPYIYDSTMGGAHVQIMEYPNAKIYLHGYDSSIDSSENHRGDHMLTFFFQEFGNIVNRTFILRFDKPVDACELSCPDGTSQVTSTFNKEKTQYKFVVNKISATKFSLVIYSKEKPVMKFNELSKFIPLE
jgi:hypothetical protein